MQNQLTVQKNNFNLQPTNFKEAMEFANLICKTSFVPAQFKGKPEETLVAMQFGSEVGLAPLQALQNIAVINGRPTIWGDAALALVQTHPDCEYIKEVALKDAQGDNRGYECTVKRRRYPEHTVIFTIEHAKKAGLWGKAGPWTTYPTRMLQMRARGFAFRDRFADALKGLIFREEAQDYPTNNNNSMHDVTPNIVVGHNYNGMSYEDMDVAPLETVIENVDAETGEINYAMPKE